MTPNKLKYRNYKPFQTYSLFKDMKNLTARIGYLE